MSAGFIGKLSPKHHGPAVVVKILCVLVTNSASSFPTLPSSFARRLMALRVIGHADIIGFVGREIEVLHAPIGIHQILEHAEQQFDRIRVSRAQLVVALGKLAKLRVFGMFQDERDVRPERPGTESAARDSRRP